MENPTVFLLSFHTSRQSAISSSFSEEKTNIRLRDRVPPLSWVEEISQCYLILVLGKELMVTGYKVVASKREEERA